MDNHDVLLELKRNAKDNKKLLNQLVIDRVSKTDKMTFSLKEIKEYSQFLNISMNQLLHEVLSIKPEDYQKVVEGKLKIISSDKFEQAKFRLLKKKKNIYKYRINWNKRTYFNKEKVELKAKKFSVNTLDFSIYILGKSRPCAIRVLKSLDNKKRFYIGKYVSCKLPNDYFENNVKEISRIAKCAVRNAIFKFRIKLNQDEFNDEVQNNLSYIWREGNWLDKFGNPMIKDCKIKPKHIKKFYYKAFYNELMELKKREWHAEYNEKLKYGDNQEQTIPIEEYHFMKEFDDMQRKISQLIMDGFGQEEILSKLEISKEFYDEQIELIKEKYVNAVNILE